MEREPATDVMVVLDGAADSDAAELDEATRQLRRRLLELDVEAVESARDTDVPDQAKPAEVVTVGALVVTLAPPVLKAVVDALTAWWESQPVRQVELTMGGDSLVITDPADDDQQQLIQAFLDAHEGG